MAERRWRVGDADAGARLDKWLADPERLVSRGRAAKAIARGQVFVDEHEETDGTRRVCGGEEVRVWPDRPGSSGRRLARRAGDLSIVYEDGRLLVADKPAGLLTVPQPGEAGEPSLRDAVARHWRSHGKRNPLVVHRIDRDTSGLVVFAKDAAAWRGLKQQFARREPERRYVAVVEGLPEPPFGTWRDWLRWNSRARRQEAVTRNAARALEAVTRYRVMECFQGLTLLDVGLASGRQHQVRVQAWLHGHPLAGERIYRTPGATSAIAFPRQALHAVRLGFRHPGTGEPLCFEAPMPLDLARLLARLRSGAAERPARRS